MQLKYIIILLNFILAPILNGQWLADRLGTEEAASQNVRFGHLYTSPLFLSSKSQIDIASGNERWILGYEQNNDRGTRFSIDIFQNNQTYVIRDSSNLSLDVKNRDHSSLAFRINQIFNKNEFDFEVGIRETMGVDKLHISYVHHWKQVDFFTQILLDRKIWMVSIENQSKTVPGLTNYNLSLVRSGSIMRTRLGTFSLAIDTPLPMKYRFPFDDIGVKMTPVQYAYDIKYSRELSNKVAYGLFVANRSDTLNTDIKKSESTIGKLYAFDTEYVKMGLFIYGVRNGISLTHHFARIDFSGMVMASYFGDLFTQLSGARYFHQINGSSSWLDFKLWRASQKGARLQYRMESSFIAGIGKLHASHYVFQLFNPLTDLRIQELEFHSYILEKISVQLEKRMLLQLDVSAEIDYIIPLYLDLEVSPPSEYKMTDFSLGTRYRVNIRYKF
ncbi:MAG: hypothetical protein K9N35_01830 [Candidatus Marinimicrobia bacterium]|nr:hypothetical protein [Candidatus Neomarinimicrobiota bacterium]